MEADQHSPNPAAWASVRGTERGAAGSWPRERAMVWPSTSVAWVGLTGPAPVSHGIHAAAEQFGRTKHPDAESGRTDVRHVVSSMRTLTFTEPNPARGP